MLIIGQYRIMPYKYLQIGDVWCFLFVQQLQSLSNDNSLMKSRVRRLEEDNQKKDREIEQLLDPSKSDEMRRTLADRKPDAGTV